MADHVVTSPAGCDAPGSRRTTSEVHVEVSGEICFQRYTYGMWSWLCMEVQLVTVPHIHI